MSKFKLIVEHLISKEIRRRLTEATETAAELAKKLMLTYAGWGKWMDENGDIVAKTVDGQLIRHDPEPFDPDQEELHPSVLEKMEALWKKTGVAAYEPAGAHHVNPGWNKGMQMRDDDIPFDANGEKTVAKLLAMTGDPRKLVRWLIKKWKEETPNGKQRILQYLGILKKLGIMDPEPEQQEQPAQSGNGSAKPRRKITARDLLSTEVPQGVK